MKPYHVILLAGGEKGPLFESTGYAEKALIPIHGKSMLHRVIEVFRASQHVGEIVVVGSSSLDKIEAMRHVHKRVMEGLNVVQNLVHAITYVKHWLHNGAADHNGYVVSFCDAVFLTPEIVDETLQNIADADADIVLHYVEKATFERNDLPAERTYIPIGDKLYTGTTIYYLKKFSRVFAALPKLAEWRNMRKNPGQLLQSIGCDGHDITEIEEALSRELSVKVRICISDHAGLGMDVDKPSDLALANELLPECES